jgi:CHAD domain-containing protein
MKARRILLDGLATPHSAVHRVVSVRFAEVLALAGAFATQRGAELHALRIACKRLRYSIELFEQELPALKASAQRVQQLQDELGEVHDCDVLGAMAQDKKANHLGHRLRRDRERHALRAKALWVDAFSKGGPLLELVKYTGFGAPTI